MSIPVISTVLFLNVCLFQLLVTGQYIEFAIESIQMEIWKPEKRTSVRFPSLVPEFESRRLPYSRGNARDMPQTQWDCTLFRVEKGITLYYRRFYTLTLTHTFIRTLYLTLYPELGYIPLCPHTVQYCIWEQAL